MRSGGKGVKILPRVLFEGWSVNDYMDLFANERMMHEVAEFITQFVDVSDCTNVFLCMYTIAYHSYVDKIFVPKIFSALARADPDG